MSRFWVQLVISGVYSVFDATTATVEVSITCVVSSSSSSPGEKERESEREGERERETRRGGRKSDVCVIHTSTVFPEQ